VYHCSFSISWLGICTCQLPSSSSSRHHNTSTDRHKKKLEHGDDDYECLDCDLSFRYLSNFNQHKLSKSHIQSKQLTRSQFRIFQPTPVLSVVSELLASVLREPSLHPHKPPLRSTLSLRVSISIPPSPVLVLRNFARTSSDPPPLQSTVSLLTPRSTNPRSTRSSLSEGILVFLEFKSSLPTTSTARSPTSQLTPMRPLPTVLPSKPPFSPVTLLQNPPTKSFFSMLRHCPSVSKLLVVK
jgi:hypothetical protein